MADVKIIGLMISVFVGVIVALSLFSGGITSNVAAVTNTQSIVNESIVFPATATPVTFGKGQAVSNVVVKNLSNGTLIPATNYTITNYVVSNGALVAQLRTTGGNVYNGSTVYVSYTYEPYGYATDSGSRALMNLIIIFAALAVVAFVVVTVVRNDVFSAFK